MQDKDLSDEGRTQKIVLHEKAFAHLTRGMYRSPASAVRELVSNAWDAGASKVNIRTGFPHFVEMSVVDNGDGFDKAEFLRIVQGGLGNSEKRVRGPSSHPDRPLIGRLGIGMFGIAQICGAFIVSSNPKSGEPFKARIRLYSLLKEELDKPDTELVEEKELKDDTVLLEVHIGEYELLDFDPDEFDGTGTRILADVMHPVFTRTFREAAALPDGIPERDWVDVLAQAQKHHSLQEMGDYFRFVWEIAASAPVPYLDSSAVPNGMVDRFQKELLDADFQTFIDGIQIFKPVWLKGNKNGYTTVPVPDTTDTPYNRRISFSGYIAVQEGLQLRPDELRGIMVRVKGVGIGLYDPSLLDYRFNEGPRSRWITGEIYVSEGLEDALNVDRDSFNRFHPQFKFLQNSVHNILRNKLMPPVYAKLKERSTTKAATRKASRRQVLNKTLEQTFSAKAVEAMPLEGKPPAYTSPRSRENPDKFSLNVVTEDEGTLNTKKSNRQLASSIMALFDASSLEEDPKTRRQTFRDALLKLLREW